MSSPDDLQGKEPAAGARGPGTPRHPHQGPGSVLSLAPGMEDLQEAALILTMCEPPHVKKEEDRMCPAVPGHYFVGENRYHKKNLPVLVYRKEKLCLRPQVVTVCCCGCGHHESIL